MALTQIRGNTQIISGTITDTQISASAAISTSKLAQGANFLQRDGSVALTASLPAGGFTITGLAAPVNPNDAATMGYVDSVATGLDVKASVRAATTASITLSGTQTIDGVALSVGNRVLVKDQATGSQNGLYLVAAGAWTRTTDADTSAEVTPGMFTFVEEGTANADSGWTLTNDGTVTLGTTALTFVQFSGAGQITAGNGLSKVGNTLSVDTAIVATLSGIQTLTNKSIDAGQLTGTIVAARMPAFTGDVTTSAGSTATTIAANAVTYSKIQAASGTSKLLGSAGSTAITEITMGSNLSITGSALTLGSSVTLLGNTTTGTGTTLVLSGAPTLNNLIVNQTANGNTVLTSTRFTDTAPTGNFIDFKNAATASLFTVDITGSLTAGTVPTGRLTGTLGTGQFPALTGDVTTSAGSVATAIGNNKVTLGMLATLAANSVIGNLTGSTATPVAVSAVSAATGSTIAVRNASANLLANNFIANAATTATSGGTTTLTVASAELQQLTGSSTQTVVLPDATTLTIGHQFVILNRSSGVVTVNANGGGLVQTMAAASQTTVTVLSIGTTAGSWDSAYSITNGSAANGTVTSVSVVSTNGLAGTSSGGTTPALTLSTTVSGLLKGNATAISAATNGTDYVNNANFVVRETPAGAVNGSNTAYTLANTPVTGTEQVYVNGLLQESGAGNDYTISGTGITMLTTLVAGDKLRVTYMK